MSDNSVSGKIRKTLIDFKHERISLGKAMKRMKKIVYNTNENYYTRGHTMGKWKENYGKES